MNYAVKNHILSNILLTLKIYTFVIIYTNLKYYDISYSNCAV